MESQRRILLVDDDAEAREILGEFFADEGFVVDTAPDAATALAKLGRFRPDIVVTDFEMPGMNGLELIRHIEARDPGRPTLLVTAREDSSLFDAEPEGFAAIPCLHKPVDLDDLTVAVRRLLLSDEFARYRKTRTTTVS